MTQDMPELKNDPVPPGEEGDQPTEDEQEQENSDG
jgi:hypothetical protein